MKAANRRTLIVGVCVGLAILGMGLAFVITSQRAGAPLPRDTAVVNSPAPGEHSAPKHAATRPARDIDVGQPPPPPPPPAPSSRPAAAPEGTEISAKASPDIAAQLLARAQQIDALPQGKIVLVAPDNMKIGDKQRVAANVGFDVPIEKLRAPAQPDTQQIEGTLGVSTEMSAILSGPAFDIKPVTPEKQSLVAKHPTVWLWDVEAKQEGQQKLEATLYALGGDAANPIRIDSFTQQITVSVRQMTWGEWLESLSKEFDAIKTILTALGGIVVLVLGWFGISLARKPKGKDAHADT
jgi:hypothetical protein